jgi:hypothetical protein
VRVRETVAADDVHVPRYAHSRDVYVAPSARGPSVVAVVPTGGTDRVACTVPPALRSSRYPVAQELGLAVQERAADGVPGVRRRATVWPTP